MFLHRYQLLYLVRPLFLRRRFLADVELYVADSERFCREAFFDGRPKPGCRNDGSIVLMDPADAINAPLAGLLPNLLQAALDAVDADGCTALWAAAYNGEYHCALWILSKGPNLELRGKASNTASCTPCNAARSQRNPTIADAIDAEIELRKQDPKRVASLKSGNIDYEDFREDLRSISKNR